MRISWVLVPVLAVAGLTPAGPAAAATPAIRGDFNGDGWVDLAVGAPREAIGNVAGAGAVTVLYGRSSSGFVATGAQVWHQNAPGVAGSAEPGDGFGGSVASGDFDGDGYADLAIGAPGEDYGTEDRYRGDMGVTQVLYGSPSGLTAAGDQLFSGGESPTGGAAGGSALATGDWNDDGADDLAIGAPGAGATGAVEVRYGSPGGLVAEDYFGAPNSGVQSDRYGAALASGDFDGDGVDDLAVGAPGRSDVDGAGPPPRNVVAAGTVYVLSGAAGDGLSGPAAAIDQDTPDVPDTAEEHDLFGSALAAGDVNGDGKDDLAIGVPGERGGTGAIHVLRGSAAGPTATGGEFWYRGAGGGLPGVPSSGSGLGTALAAGDLDDDGKAEIAIGIGKDDIGSRVNAGSVTVLHAFSDGTPRVWHQDVQGVPGAAEAGDWFGHSVAVNARGDLVVGAPREALGATRSAGVVHVLSFGTIAVSRMWSQDSAGVPGAAETPDWFGAAVS